MSETPKTPVELAAETDWDAAITSEVPIRYVPYGGKTYYLQAPADSARIDAEFKGQNKLQPLAVAWSADTKTKITWNDVLVFNLIMLCDLSKKLTKERLAKMRKEQGPLYTKLKQATWDACGLLDVSGAMDDGLGNSNDEAQ